MKNIYLTRLLVLVIAVILIVACSKDDSDSLVSEDIYLVSPTDGAVEVDTDVLLRWNIKKYPSNFDYAIYIGNNSTDLKRLPYYDFSHSDHDSDGMYFKLDLDYNKTYYWKVVIGIGENNIVESQVWSFSTLPDSE